MTLDPAERVRAIGWTRATMVSAIEQLVAGDGGSGAVGQELLRQLRCAPDDCLDTIVFSLNYAPAYTPSADDPNPWNALLRPDRGRFNADALTRLRSLYEHSELVTTLRSLLEEVAQPDASWKSLDDECRQILEALLVLGTSERYLLERYRLLIPDEDKDFETLQRLVDPHRDAFRAASMEVFLLLDWGSRLTLLLLFSDLALPLDGFVELLLEVDGATLVLEDRTRYVEALGLIDPQDDNRPAQRIDELLTQALSSPRGSDPAWINFIRRAVGNLGERTTSEQQRLAARCGLD